MGRTPSYIVHRGFRLPKSFPREMFASALEYQAAAGDIFVSAYPKCGTTWTQNIVYLLLQNGVPVGAGDKLTELFPHLEEVGSRFVESLASPRCIKTHLPFAMTPCHRDARYIYVARNPFDCAVSFFHHTRGFSRHYEFAEGTFADFFECFLAGEVDFGDYFDNLASWYAHRDAANVLFLTYEEMKRDTRAAIAEIAAFLGCDSTGDTRLLAIGSQAQPFRQHAQEPTTVVEPAARGDASVHSPRCRGRLDESIYGRTSRPSAGEVSCQGQRNGFGVAVAWNTRFRLVR